MRYVLLIIASLWLPLIPSWAIAAKFETVTVKTPRGVSQLFQLITPDNPKAAVILFIGGNGNLDDNEKNFLITAKAHFADRGMLVALVAPPSDQKNTEATFRMGKQHADDMISVIKYLGEKADVPIWLVGTSMGTFSAASVAIKKQKRVAGLVLTSTMTHLSGQFKGLAKKLPDGVASMNLNQLKIPVLIMSHARDRCEHTPPQDSEKLKRKLSKSPRVEAVLLEGGFPEKSDPCQALSAHGFYGIEKDAVDRIVSFITQ